MSRKKSGTSLPPPFLKRVSLIADRMAGKKGYPYNLPWLADPEFEVNSMHESIFGENENSRTCH
jgi:hypothetical protein